MTNTDRQWLERLAGIMPENFLKNISGEYEPVKNLLDTMINMIGRTIIDGVDNPYNPFGIYTQATMDYGDTIQNYKTKYVQGEQYDPEATDVFAQSKSKPLAQYYQYNDKVQYPITIFDDQLKLAFTGQERFGDFVSTQIDSLYESDGLDKYTKWKKFMANSDNFGQLYPITISEVTDPKEYGTELLKGFKELVTRFKQPNTMFNKLGDMAISSGVDIIMRATDKNIIDVEVLAGVYNLEKLDIDARFIFVDDFATLCNSEGVSEDKELVAIVCDRRAWGYVPRTPITSSIYNPKALATNYWLTIQGIYYCARFRNIVGIYKNIEPTHEITMGVNPIGTGRAEATSERAYSGAVIGINAEAYTSYHFRNWTVVSGGVEIADPTSPRTYFTMGDEDVVIQAEISDNQLSSEVTPEGSGSVTMSETHGTSGTVINIRASANQGYAFVSWEVASGDGQIDSYTSANTTITMREEDTVIRAVFEPL